jgi:hypothetical protein
MDFKPVIKKSGKYFLVAIKEIDATTQGFSMEEARMMAKDLLESLFLGYFDKKIEVESKVDCKGDLLLVAPDQYAVPLILRCLRLTKKITIEEINHVCGFKSPNAYAQYEKGRRMPSVEQFSRLLATMGAHLRVERAQETR